MSSLLQRDNLFYTAMSYCSPATLMRIPYSLTEAVVWTVLTYFEVGLAANPGRYNRLHKFYHTLSPTEQYSLLHQDIVAQDTTLVVLEAWVLQAQSCSNGRE